MHNYGALFLGENTCVSYGDKVIGTNHVLPTLGAARYTGGLWVGKYLKTVTYQEVRDEASSGELGRVCGRAARVELFEGHARSGDVRAWRHLGDRHDWIDEALAESAADHRAMSSGRPHGVGHRRRSAVSAPPSPGRCTPQGPMWWSPVGERSRCALTAELGERADWRVCDVADADSVAELADSLAGDRGFRS